MNIFDPQVSGSLSVSGSGQISGDLTVLGTLYATISGTAENAVSASHAAAYTLTSSFHTHTSSFNNFTASYNTGSFTGSFTGDGAGLYNIPASGVTGLNLTQISDGAATASISAIDGFKVNTNAEFTGSVNVTGSIYLNGEPIGTGKLDETVFNTYSSSNDLTNSAQNGRLDALETATSSLNSYTNSNNLVISSLQSTTSSLNTFTSSADGRLNSLEVTTGSLNSFTSSTNSKLSSIENTTSSLNTYTASANNKFSSLESASSSIRTDLNLYTSSNDSRLASIESSTASLNTVTSSILGAIEITGSNLTVKGNLLVKGTTTQIDSTTLNIGDNIISLNGTATNNAGLVVQDASGASIVSGSLLWDSSLDYWKAGKLGSEEKIILSGEYNTFSTSIDSRANNLESSTASLNSYTSSTNTRLGVIETTTGSLNSYTSSTNTRLGVIESTTSSINTFTSSANDRLNSLENASSSIRSDFNSYTSSNDSTNTTQNSRLTSLESTTSSLNTFTSSTNTRLGVIESTTSSLNSYTSSNNTNINAIHVSTSSLNEFTSSASTRFNTIETTTASLNSFTSSTNTKLIAIETATSSLNSFTSSINTTIKNKLNTDGVISGSVQIDITQTSGYSTFSSSLATTDSTQDGRISSLEGETGSYATTGSNSFNGNQTITGSLTITQNLTVLGSSSLLIVTSSQLALSSSFISVNVFEPAERFGGLKVYDSGSLSHQATASLAWDSLRNHWVYQNASGSNYSGGMLIAGPRNSGSLGDEPSLTSGKIVKSVGGDHIDNSIMNESGDTIFVTGSLSATGTVYGTNITAIETSTSSLNTFTSSATNRLNSIESTTGSLNSFTSSAASKLSAIETATGSLNSYTSSTNTRLSAIESTTSSLNSHTSSTNTRLSAIELTTSSLNTYTSSNNIRLNTIESTTSSLNTFTSSANGRLGSIETSTGSLNSFTSSANSRLGSLESASSSIRTDFNSYTSSNDSTNTTQNNRLNSIESTTGSLNTYTGSNTTNINAIHTATSSLNTFTNSFNSAFSLSGADVTVKGNFTVSGTTTTVNSTTVAIGDNIIQLNGTGATNAGLVVRDATSPNTVSGSLLWDTTNDKWIAGALGAEDDIVLRTASQTLTNKTINASQLVDASVTNAKLANSSISIAGNNVSLGGAITAATILSGTGVVSGSAQLTSSFVQKAGDTMTGQLVVGSTGTANSATLKINNSTAISFNHSIEVLAANMTSGQTNLIVLGVSGSTKNAGYLGYNWSSAGSDTNYVSLGHWGSDNLLRVYGNGNVYMGTVTTGVWNGTAIGDAYISSSSNWNTAYNKRVTGVTLTSSTLTITAGDGTTVTASVPTFNQNTTGTAANITASSNTSLTSLSNLATVGTITSGTWQGSSISTTYTAAKVTAVNAGPGVGVDTTTGSVTVSIGQSVATTAVVTFKAITLTSDSDSRVLNLRELGPTSGNIIQFQSSAGVNTWELVGRSGTGATPFYIYKNAGTNSGYIFSISDGGIPNFHTALTVNGNTVYHAGNIPTWNQNTTGTASNITAYSINQNLSTTSSPTFANPSVTKLFVAGDSWIVFNNEEGAWGIKTRTTTNTGNLGASLKNIIYCGGGTNEGFAVIGTGTGNASFEVTNAGNAYIKTSLTINGSTAKSFANSSYATSFSNVSSVTVTHNLGSKDVMVMVYDSNDEMFWPSSIVTTNTNVVTITFAANRTGRVVVMR